MNTAKRWVLSVPIRNWNFCSWPWWICMFFVLSVPIRNWNQWKQGILPYLLSVLSVPIRNWNSWWTGANSWRSFCFKRTYKELKQYSNWRSGDFKSKVLSVPIRNWNTVEHFGKCQKDLVLSVPIRNWNYVRYSRNGVIFSSFKRTYKELKLDNRILNISCNLLF